MTYTEDYINGVMEYTLSTMEDKGRDRRIAVLKEVCLNLSNAPCTDKSCEYCELSIIGKDKEVYCIALLMQEMEVRGESGRLGYYVV